MGRDDSRNLGLYKRVVASLEDHPAYLLVFAVSALFVLSGLGSSIVAVSTNSTTFGGLGLLSFICSLLSVIFVVNKVENEISPKGTVQNKLPDLLVACPYMGNGPVKMTKEQEKILLADLPKWEIVETKSIDGQTRRELYRSYQFKSFECAFDFMKTAVDGVISEQNHHPRWENVYNKVNIWLTTFDLNDELSNRDECMARNLEALWEKNKGIEP